MVRADRPVGVWRQTDVTLVQIADPVEGGYGHRHFGSGCRGLHGRIGALRLDGLVRWPVHAAKRKRMVTDPSWSGGECAQTLQTAPVGQLERSSGRLGLTFVNVDLDCRHDRS